MIQANRIRQVGINLFIKPTYIVSTPLWENVERHKTKKQKLNELNLKDNNHKGKVSNKAAKKIKNAINWLVASAQLKRVWSKKDNKAYYFKINFITLTLPVTSHKISDHYFKANMMRKFIDNCRYKYGLKNYVWKVEAQKNGNIHAHFTTDTFIHYRDLLKTWNKILEKEGLIDEFEKLHKHRNPNSVDVKSVKSIKKIASYMAKYMTKNDDTKREIKGRLWGCNYLLSDSHKCSMEVSTNEYGKIMRELEKLECDYMEIRSKPDVMGDTKKIAEITFINPVIWSKLQSKQLKTRYETHLFTIKNNLNVPSNYWHDYQVYPVNETSERNGCERAAGERKEFKVAIDRQGELFSDADGQEGTNISNLLDW